ncbi:hypothetical protein [Bradyrhizobium sp. CCBAU 51627]|uniref:hypothetical protein n=1 Tax=Bradyrhizobium sp. CCBAU 51627 TaxID=1325088 RepID=UPI0023051174|nr:hypothetical protein [Bradyrhizobium sp. CCBAU 51627]
MLAGLGTLAVMELDTSPRAIKPVNALPAHAAVGPHDTLTTADRLEIPHMLQAQPQPMSSNEVVHLPNQTAIVVQQTSKIIEQKRSARERKSAVALPKPRVERGTATAKLNLIRPVAEVKPCPSGVFEGLFRVLNLSTRCQT